MSKFSECEGVMDDHLAVKAFAQALAQCADRRCGPDMCVLELLSCRAIKAAPNLCREHAEEVQGDGRVLQQHAYLCGFEGCQV